MMPMKMSPGCRPRSGVACRYHRNWIGRHGWRCRSWRDMRAQEPRMPIVESWLGKPIYEYSRLMCPRHVATEPRPRAIDGERSAVTQENRGALAPIFLRMNQCVSLKC